MLPLSLRLRNVGPFPRLDLDLPAGCTAVTGHNGSGKSTLLNSVDVALFAERGELAGLLTTGEERLEIELTFEHAERVYKVRRQYDGRGRGKTLLDLEEKGWPIGDGGEFWHPLALESALATQERLCGILGLTRTPFRASAFAGQGDGAAFAGPHIGAANRKAILSEILGLGIWDRLHARTRADIAAAETRAAVLADLAQRLQAAADLRPAAEGALAQARADEAQAAAALAAAERELEAARAALAAQEAARERVRAAEQVQAAAVQELARATEDYDNALNASLAKADTEACIAEAAPLAGRVAEMEQKVEELRQEAERAREARRRRDEANRRAEEFAAGGVALADDAARLRVRAAALRAQAALVSNPEHRETCDRCGQLLAGESAEVASASYRDEAQELEKEADALDLRVEMLLHDADALRADAVSLEIPPHVPAHVMAAALQDASDARDAALRHARLVERHAALCEKAEMLPAAQAALEIAREHVAAADTRLVAARTEVGDADALEAAELTASVTFALERSRLDDARIRATRSEMDVEQSQQAEQELAETVEEASTLADRLDVLKLAERAYGRDGIPALILEAAAIPAIEADANRILARLGRPYRVELRTQRALKTADHLRETLDVIVSDGLHERPYETFSTGERTRIDIALRVALARLLANRRGAEVQMLVLDEPDGLDRDGMGRLVELLQEMGDTFPLIYVIAHDEQLAGAFDQTLTLRRDGEHAPSRIVGQPEREPVAA